MRNNIFRWENESAQQMDEQSGRPENRIGNYGWNFLQYIKDKWNQIVGWRSPGLYDDIKAGTDILFNSKARELFENSSEVHNGTSKVNFRYSDGSTPLTRVLKLNDQTKLEYLLQVPGIDLEFTEEIFPVTRDDYIEPIQTPLIVAVKTGQIHLVRQILVAGANVHTRDSHNNTALFHSVDRDYEDITDLLLQYNPLLHCLGDGLDPLHQACDHCNFNLVKMLVTAGCCVNPQKDNQVPPLLYSVLNSSEEICLYLLEHRADIHYKGSCDTEPFLQMCQMGLPAPIHFCVNTGVDVHMRTEHGMTTLMLATKLHNYVTQRSLLLGSSGKISKLEPAVCDLYQRRICVVKCLIKAGCDLDSKYEFRGDTMTALYMAMRNSNLPVAVVLLKHCATWDDKCQNEMINEYKLLQKGAFMKYSNYVFILKKYIPKILATIPHKYCSKIQKQINKCFTIPTLKDSCRKVIHQSLKNYTKSTFERNSSIWPLIESLNLPKLLHYYLCYDEINEGDFADSIT